MAFPLDTPYYSIPGSGAEPTFGAMMEMLLKARLALHLETHTPIAEEDVNTYLAGVLVSYIDPIHLREIWGMLSRYDSDVVEAVDKAQDRSEVYFIYKVNADDLLMSLGIFQTLWPRQQKQVSRMRRYYTYASEYQRRIYGKTTAVGEIQAKLSDRAERYLSILSTARSDYLRFVDPIRLEELKKFGHEILQWQQMLPIKAKQDTLLDLYSQWIKGPQDPALRRRLLALIDELKIIDTNFPAKAIASQL